MSEIPKKFSIFFNHFIIFDNKSNGMNKMIKYQVKEKHFNGAPPHLLILENYK